MGLDTTIYAKEEPIYYYRKNWDLQDWFNKLGEEKYKHLAQAPRTKEDYDWDISDEELQEENERRKTEIDFNCVKIPVTEEDWDLFTMEMDTKYGSGYDEECDKAVRAAFKAKKEVFVYGWW